jgi:multidrug resistance efflux pump
MSKKKLSLQQLQVSGLVTDINQSDLEQVKGGAVYVRGKRFTFRVRWTTVDTRVETGDKATGVTGN